MRPYDRTEVSCSWQLATLLSATAAVMAIWAVWSPSWTHVEAGMQSYDKSAGFLRTDIGLHKACFSQLMFLQEFQQMDRCVKTLTKVAQNNDFESGRQWRTLSRTVLATTVMKTVCNAALCGVLWVAWLKKTVGQPVTQGTALVLAMATPIFALVSVATWAVHHVRTLSSIDLVTSYYFSMTLYEFHAPSANFGTAYTLMCLSLLLDILALALIGHHIRYSHNRLLKTPVMVSKCSGCKLPFSRQEFDVYSTPLDNPSKADCSRLACHSSFIPFHLLQRHPRDQRGQEH